LVCGNVYIVHVIYISLLPSVCPWAKVTDYIVFLVIRMLFCEGVDFFSVRKGTELKYGVGVGPTFSLVTGQKGPNTRKAHTKKSHFKRIPERPTFGFHILNPLSGNSVYGLCFIIICLYIFFLSQSWLVRSVYIEFTLKFIRYFSFLSMFILFYRFWLATDGLKIVETFAI